MSRDIKYTGILRLVLVCMLSVSCHQRETLHTGDLIFVGNPQDQPLDEDSIDSAISAATGSGSINRTHTAIVEVDSDGHVWIIDATPKRGVDRHPLDTFLMDFRLKDGSYPVLKSSASRTMPVPMSLSASPSVTWVSRMTSISCPAMTPCIAPSWSTRVTGAKTERPSFTTLR